MTLDSESSPQHGVVTLLAIGDVHLGTRPASLPETLGEWGVEPRDLAPEAALGAAVDVAVSRRVDAVVFAGDVVDSTNARFEAIRPLEEAVRRLVAAGISVLAVAGNHDVEALPRLAGLIEGFILLGEGGVWGSHVLERAQRPPLEIVGWSFPEREVRASPVAGLREALAPARPGVPRIGLLHADLDASGGSYAPVASRELEETGFDAWLLGHVHRPSLVSQAGAGGSIPCGYLGSLVGLDPTETGPHGPWLIRVEGPGRVQVEQLPIAPLRWESLDVPVGGIESVEDVGDRLLDEAERLARQIQGEHSSPRALGVRVRVKGATALYGELRARIQDATWSGVGRTVGETVVFVDKVLDRLELAVDLEGIAVGDDPPALLARKLLALERGGEAARALLAEARSCLMGVANAPTWSPLRAMRGEDDPLVDEVLRTHLERAGTAALHALLAQRGGEGSGAP
jgi:DNA repair exonuclease SbcCD nuclease subunit